MSLQKYNKKTSSRSIVVKNSGNWSKDDKLKLNGLYIDHPPA